jgi:hypothetical protein
VIARPNVTDCLNRLLTSDFRGAADKMDALQTLMAPVVEALLMCEIRCDVRSPESDNAKRLLNLLGDYGLTAKVRDHEEFEKELKESFRPSEK